MRHAQKERITTCGSGHFLLGAFARLHERWQRHSPALGARELVAKALDGIYGVDINPFAVAIARFRLLVAALHAAGDTSIEQNIGYTPHLAAGDSLLWGANQQLLPEDLLAGPAIRADSTEDAGALRRILQREHDVVVGNPPYITPKDAALNATYRKLYSTTHRKYALTVPFMELFFRLAHGSAGSRPAGWTGQITSNSFMKREFGSKLIEEFLPTVDLRRVIDTSGAYIPGHGTPTAIIVGRNQRPSAQNIRAILGIRGEPGRPSEPAKGLVWSAITGHIDQPGFEDAYISVADLPRTGFRNHPWSLSGGGAVELTQHIGACTSRRLGDDVVRIGFFGVMGADDAFSVPMPDYSADRFNDDAYAPLIQGDDVRDFAIAPRVRAFFPYDDKHKLIGLSSFPSEARYLWPARTELGNRATFTKGTYFSDGRPWYEWHQLPADKGCSPLSITFAFVATHNHFVLDRGGKVFNRSAPVIKLPADASVEDHLRLLGVLNSSVACFWLKQNSYPKGGDPIGKDGARVSAESWSDRYEFTGTTLQDFPLTATTPVERATLLDDLAHNFQDQSPAQLAQRQTPSAAALQACIDESNRLRALMITHQEELDWEYSRIYGLIEDDLTYTGDPPGITLGERAFEIALARRMKDGEETAWFERHGSTPITEIPDHFPADYRDLLQRRLDAIESNPRIRLLEKPEYKRRWASEPWDKQVERALRGWLLDRVEDRALWFDRDGRPMPQSVAQLADVLDRDADFRSVLQLWANDSNATTGAALAKLLADEAVPYLAAYRYKDSGLDKRSAWEDTWALQRREDAGEKLASPIPVPPKYKPADFVKGSYWSHRGKLDVPKERFVGYTDAGRDTDSTDLLGWAGWDHAQQALALASLISTRIDEGWETAKLVPLLAGLNEIAPWVRQWHNQIDPEYGESVADTIDAELTSRLNEHHLTVTDLTSWRPVPRTRGRSRRSASS